MERKQIAIRVIGALTTLTMAACGPQGRDFKPGDLVNVQSGATLENTDIKNPDGSNKTCTSPGGEYKVMLATIITDGVYRRAALDLSPTNKTNTCRGVADLKDIK